MLKRTSPFIRVVSICATYTCNLSCKHCGQGSSKKDEKELTLEEIKSFLLQSKKLGAKRLNLTGGEIFTRSDALDIIVFAQKKGFNTSIETNATLITDDILERISKLPNLFLSISLDGIDPKTHDFFRGVDGSFKKTIKILEKCSKLNIPFRATTTLNRTNINQIYAIYKKVSGLGGKYRLLTSIQMYCRGTKARKNYGISGKELIDFLEKTFFPLMKENEKNKKGYISIELPISIWPPDLNIDYGPLCPWGESLVGLSPNGNVGICHVAGGERELIAGNIRDKSLKEIWENSRLFRSLRQFDSNKLKGVCSNCLAKFVCRGGCRVHAYRYYKDLYAPNPDCQILYEDGFFPDYALENPKKSCSYKLK